MEQFTNFLECVALLKEIFEKCESHCVGHVIKAAVLRRNNPFFTKLFAQLFTSDLLTRRVERSIEEKVSFKLANIGKRGRGPKVNVFTKVALGNFFEIAIT